MGTYTDAFAIKGSKNGGDCQVLGCGSKNPAVGAAAHAMLAQTNQFLVAQAFDAQIQNVGAQIKSSGITLG